MKKMLFGGHATIHLLLPVIGAYLYPIKFVVL